MALSASMSQVFIINCPGQVIELNLKAAVGWSVLMELEGGAFRTMQYKTWMKKVEGKMLRGIVFTEEVMIGFEKRSGTQANFLWKILYDKIGSMGNDGKNIVVSLKTNIKTGMFFHRNDRFVLQNWGVESLPVINKIILAIMNK
ncbi:hypothetical protein EIN_203550 [Entamoeba invadens IP1]|uniref:Intermembrane lipid transfer protein VPS13-like C-terminal domain-containing protein n=1 Tax=Entamoeba invadens IP1 TaxID=370355 RepID=A0A0A1U0I4_ENTIV|nr:hypothetical protein EIN_203550 [Entamoeba invadens IP1]ELP84417.1 hypothetical protein EIN_203550 [Entamoeba invadens IP1]|eukprot:XP_004183763.1 hypothetical protein EIN_203550 [Entamoeba invadens IP1]